MKKPRNSVTKGSQKLDAPRHSIRTTKKRVDTFRKEIKEYYDTKSFLSWSSSKKKYVMLGATQTKNGLVTCPECGLGELMVIRSRKSGKRFMGCSNYYNGCKASSPLLQRARMRSLRRACEHCGWPIIMFRYTIRQKWIKQCSNYNCKTKIKEDDTGRSSGS